MSIVVFLDCGAPSLYNKLSRGTKDGKRAVMGSTMRNRKRDQFDYVKSKEYLAYRQDFVDFVKANPHIDTYPNLDVINNAQLTWENQRWLEAQGLTPCPVWHLGSDEGWLMKYLSEGYRYICIGGMVPNTKNMLRPALDRIWKNYLTAPNGFPTVKVHGFAMTSFDLMYRYPWYSVDSKSWIDIAKFGAILVPPLRRDGERDYLHPAKVFMTSRSVAAARTFGAGLARPSRHHFLTTAPGTAKGVLRYLKEVGIPAGKSEFKTAPEGYELLEGESWVDEKARLVEVVLEKGVTNCHYMRLDVNIQLYRKIEEVVPEWPWPLPPSIKGGKVGLFE